MTHGVGILLLAAVAGYWVLERAAAHKGRLKQVGQLVGGLVIVMSLVGAVCTTICTATGSMGMCSMKRGMKAGGYTCPLTGASMPGAKSAPPASVAR